jgi:hypothetical protein
MQNSFGTDVSEGRRKTNGMVVGFGVITMAAAGMATILTWNENTEG